MTANDWWCPACGHTQNAPVADRPDPEPASTKCPTCESPDPDRHPAVQCEGEVQLCPDPWHSPLPDDVAAVELAYRPVGDDTRLPPGVERTDDSWVLDAFTETPAGWQAQEPVGGRWRSGVAYAFDVPVRPVGVPVGDDTTCGYCGAAFDLHDLSAMGDCNRLLRAALDSALIDVPVGDDTPAPTTGEWTVREKSPVGPLLDHPDGTSLQPMGSRDGETALGVVTRVAADLNRAGAAPDLTALPTAEQVTAWLIEHEHDWQYVTTSDPAHPYVVAVLAAVAALVREDTTDG